jgi:uncharacterized protein (TIGR02678 family)
MNATVAPIGEAKVLDHLRVDDRRRALRALLRKPLLLAEDPADADEFTRVRRHADDLREWFSRQAGWSLDITADFARLRKTPADLADASRPAQDHRSNEPFTRRRYVLLCLALAVLVREERQTTLGRLADQMMNLWNQDAALVAAGMVFRMETPDERRDLVQVVRLLLAWQALRRLDGAEDRFIRDRAADVLYNVRHIVISRLFAGRRAPSLVSAGTLDEQLAALVEEPLIDTDEQRNRRIRLGLVRRLLDDPVIYYCELTAEEQAYLLRQRWHLMGQLAEATGFVPEERKEGFALTDPFGDCSDVGMPEEGTDGHATILVAEFLAARRSESKGSIVPMPAVADFVAAKAIEHRTRWRREATVAGREHEFAQEIVARLAGLGLVRINPDGVLPMPAIHRFRLRAPIETKHSIE